MSEITEERWLTALPVYNEVKYVADILGKVTRYADDVLVVDDGSIDGTAEILAKRDDVHVSRHPENRGYGAALVTAFDYALHHGYDGVVTIDCDGQHQPQMIPRFIEAAADAEIVSGSRYLAVGDGDNAPPEERYAINRRITNELNHRLGFALTDAFCGFKAYRSEALAKLAITETGYAMPLQLWVQAAAADLRVSELAVPLIYLDLERSFGGSLDQAEIRLRHYHRVLDEAFAAAERNGHHFPPRQPSLCI